MPGRSTKLSHYLVGFVTIYLLMILYGISVMQGHTTVLSFGVDVLNQPHDNVKEIHAETAIETNGNYMEGLVKRGILKNQQSKVDKIDFIDKLNISKFFLSGKTASHRLDRECKATFFKDPADNSRYMLKSIRSSNVTRKHHSFLSGRAFSGNRKDQVVLVNAHSSNHHREFKLSLGTVKKYLEDRYKFIIFDLGLTDDELKYIKEECKFCEVRRFEFEGFPSHVANLMTYAWKPLIIHTMLQEFDYIVWMDTSARLKTSDLSGILAHAKENHIAIYDAGFNTTCFTHPATFFFFHEDPCLYTKAFQLEANFMVLYSSDYTRKVLSYSWSACALERSCMAPDGSNPFGCVRTRSPDYCGCHRFDQSVLTLILYRLMSKTSVPTPWVKPKSQPWIYDTSIADIVRSG